MHRTTEIHLGIALAIAAPFAILGLQHLLTAILG